MNDLSNHFKHSSPQDMVNNAIAQEAATSYLSGFKHSRGLKHFLQTLLYFKKIINSTRIK